MDLVVIETRRFGLERHIVLKTLRSLRNSLAMARSRLNIQHRVAGVPQRSGFQERWFSVQILENKQAETHELPALRSDGERKATMS
jgi:hypothetical protein